MTNLSRIVTATLPKCRGGGPLVRVVFAPVPPTFFVLALGSAALGWIARGVELSSYMPQLEQRVSVWLACLLAFGVFTCMAWVSAVDAAEAYARLYRRVRFEWLLWRAPVIGSAKWRAAAAARCVVPPAGWTCSRHAGHSGPCAASPVGDES